MHSSILTVAILTLFALTHTVVGQTAPEQLIASIDQQLATGQLSVSEVLSNVSWLPLHTQPAFRKIIRENAKAEKIKLVTEQEPGTRITVTTRLTDRQGKPLADALVYVYQTDHRGWYADTAAHVLTMEGDRKHARLFGYLRTDAAGQFSLETVQPQGYPRSTLPAHIHLEVFFGQDQAFISELLFDDDVRLTPAVRQRAAQEKFTVAKNSGTAKEPLYQYEITLR